MHNPSQTEQLHWMTAPCWLGWLAAARSANGLVALVLADTTTAALDALQERLAGFALREGQDQNLLDAALAVIEDPRCPTPPLDLRGSTFQQQVWRALLEIPPGQTRTYRQIAQSIGAPLAAQAVGNACGANLLAVLVPCHRALRADGGLGGYRWGLERKRALLAREGALLL